MLIQEEVKDDGGLHKARYNVNEINRLKSVELTICFQEFTFLLFDCSFVVTNVGKNGIPVLVQGINC